MIIKCLRETLPLAGLVTALLVTVVWIGFLGYVFFRLF